ncbi:hypothetical protein [Mucilaginibacter sp. HD30]
MIVNKYLRVIKAGFVLLLLVSVSFQVSAQKLPTKVIYFLAGPKDHAGDEGSGRHETRRDLLVMQHCIDSISNATGVKIVTKFSYKRTALDIEDLKGVDAIIVECSAEGSSKERAHPLFPPSGDNTKSYDKATLAYLAQLDSLHKAGMGIMVLHWGITTTNQKATQYYLSWFGSSSLSGYTRNPLGYWSVSPIEAAKNHPILRGVGPFNYKDEIFSRMVVNPGDPYRTDLLTGTIEKSNQGASEPLGIATAYDKNGARGVLWGGMDYHSALKNENYRRFVLNAILWTAGVDVPKGGVKSTAKQLALSPDIPDTFDKLKPEGFVFK